MAIGKRSVVIGGKEGIDYVVCPYCDAHVKTINWVHLKNSHGKTLDEMKKEFPGIKTKCQKSIDEKKKAGRNAYDKTKYKKIKCVECGIEMSVKRHEPVKQICSKCKKEGKKDPSENWMLNKVNVQQETMMKKHGTTNVYEIEGVAEKIEKTSVERYGGIGFAGKSGEKSKATLKNKYGVEYFKQTERGKQDTAKVRGMVDVSSKIKNTNIQKYDGTGFGSEELAKKSRDTMEEEYGVDNWYKTDEGKMAASKIMENLLTRKKVSESLKGRESKLKGKSILEKFNGDIEKTKEYLEKLKEKNQMKFLETFEETLMELNLELIDDYNNAVTKTLFKCTKCGEKFISTWGKIKNINNNIKGYNDCPICFPRNNGRSKPEMEIVDFIKSIDSDLEIIESDRIILNGSEIDIYIPTKKIGIEFNGLFYHSSLNYKNDKEKVKNSHINKTIGCEQAGIRLIHIREDQWFEKKDIVKNSLRQIFGYMDKMISISIDDCEIKEMKSKWGLKEKKIFFDENCLYGNDQSSLKLGAYYNKELVAMMTFSYKNKKDTSKWDFKNFVVKLNYSINGVASKLFNYFKDNYEWKYISVVSDRAWTNGNLFRHLGFTFVGYQIADFYVVDDNHNLYHKDYRKQLNEKGVKNGIYYDSGFVRFILKNGVLTEDDMIEAKSKFFHAALSTEFSLYMTSNCLKCGKEFEHHKNLSKSKLYCSDCGGPSIADNSVEIKCAKCGEMFIGNKHQSKSDSYCKVCRDKGFRNNKASIGGKLGADRRYKK